ncbi:4-hydroxy-3-polyprenylbenzoate decarboxylase [Natronospira proteinivora]|uniref:Flavin prenyltransferase UbiX n=1 Tax=Natronospira proteinivora TaxID=1807133 RepID=A0ABT1G524_9GAMM|nr:flavin prenyltransferase UbiX [Natronospira proteinivora]MCP1726040.1 4-hydroxy-3-polyprenylbenzoate decarboxylase [Natronospira proteinivora]
MAEDYRGDITLAMTGASGAQYGLRLLECLLQGGHRVHLMISKPAQVVIGTETDVALPGRRSEMARFLSEYAGVSQDRLRVYGQDEWTSPVASGSGAPARMIVCPCSTATLSNVAMGASRSLIERAADVVIKERGRLVMVVRETPFSEIHLDNMSRLARMGVTILPANPGFYHRPDSVEALVDFVVARTLDQLGIDHQLMARWGSGD